MHSKMSTTAPATLPKYGFYLRHYAVASQWLRQHGFKGLHPVPGEFLQHSTSLPWPSSGSSFTATLPLTVHQVAEAPYPLDASSFAPAAAPRTYPKVAAITERTVQAPVFVPQAEQRKAQRKLAAEQIRLQEMPPPIDEDYLRAVEINRRHVADRDRFKHNGSSYDARSKMRTASWDRGIPSGKHQQPQPPPPPQVHYVDYSQVETYVTRSVAPSHHGPKHHHSSVPSGQSTGSSTSAASTTSAPQKVVKRFTKNPKNRKVVCWQEQLREQEEQQSRLGRNGGGPSYDSLYGPANVSGIKARETDLQLGFDRFCDRTQPKLWPQLPVRINFNNQ